jgi:hypothetical protein
MKTRNFGLNSKREKFSTNIATFTGIIFGTIEISGAHEAGDVSFDGGSEALMDLQAITSVLNDFLQNI